MQELGVGSQRIAEEGLGGGGSDISCLGTAEIGLIRKGGCP
jgi:hypothetical protein